MSILPHNPVDHEFSNKEVSRETQALYWQDRCRILEGQIKQLMTDKYVCHVNFSSRLGQSIIVIIHGDNPKYGIWQNSPVVIHLMCHLPDTFFFSLGHTNVKFRKIRADNFDMLGAKLIVWLEKNKANFDKILEA